MTATLTDATSHACIGPECSYCGEPEELMLLRRVHVRPLLERNAGVHDVQMAGLVMDELRPLLLAALRIRDEAADWARSSTAAVAEAGRHIVRQFNGTPWELKTARQEPIPQVQELIDVIEQVHDPDDLLPPPPQEVRPVPPGKPRRCQVVRTTDVTGVSGVGVIGEGFMASDGAMVFRWFGGPPQDQPKWEFYDKPGPGPFEQISGHNGNTELAWLDEPEDDERPS